MHAAYTLSNAHPGRGTLRAVRGMRMPRMHVSKQAAALLRLMGKGWHFTPYPANGPQRELQLRNPQGTTVAYVVQPKGSTTLTTRYRQHGYRGTTGTPAQCAKGVKAHAAAYARQRAAVAARKPGTAKPRTTRGGGKGTTTRKPRTTAAPATPTT